MWNELKFAVNWNAGDTKPIRQGRNSSRSTIINHQQQQQQKQQQCHPNHCRDYILSRSRSRSMLSKSNAESLNKFGLIGEADQKSAKSRKVFIISSWRNISHSFSTGFKLWLLWREFLWRKPEVGSAAKCCSFYLKTWMFGMTWCSVITNIQYVWKLNFSLLKMQQHLVSFESTVLVKGRLYGNVNLR